MLSKIIYIYYGYQNWKETDLIPKQGLRLHFSRALEYFSINVGLRQWRWHFFLGWGRWVKKGLLNECK